MDVALVAVIGAATALATGLGVFPVWAVGTRARGLQPALEGVAAGIMAVASIAGLLLPAIDDGSAAQVAGGLVAGLDFSSSHGGGCWAGTSKWGACRGRT